MTKALIFNGGKYGDLVVPDASGYDLIVAADSGLDRAKDAGVHVDLAVGDFDSVSEQALVEAERRGTRIERHPTAKNATDLELALERAMDADASEVTVLLGSGGRLDHELSIPLLLSRPRYTSLNIRALSGTAILTVVHEFAELRGTVGQFVSLLPMHGEVRGVTTTGLSYPLQDGVLHAGTSRGVSNEFAESQASVSLSGGTLLVVQPG